MLCYCKCMPDITRLTFRVQVALIQRGTCGFYNKCLAAQSAGAGGCIIYNNAAGSVTPDVSPIPASSAPVTIPVASISQVRGSHCQLQAAWPYNLM